jgi:uncharacterized membrane protein YdjX (TVP38/TMEM64 family)
MTERKPGRTRQWLKTGLIALGVVAGSIGLGYLIRSLLADFQIPVTLPWWQALLIIFGILFLLNFSFVPLPFGVALMLVAAAHWNPVLVALAGSLGASFGEFSIYFFGLLGKKLAIKEDSRVYQMVKNWVHKYGMWAIVFISFQPVIPFDVGGFVAGVARMPIRQFLPAVMIGKFPKYLILIYLGDTLIRLFPRIHIR